MTRTNGQLITDAYAAQTKIRNINAKLSAIEYPSLPIPDLEALPDITAPDSEAVLDALRKAKGDPAADKTLQTLATRAWLAGHPALKHQENVAWIDAWESAKGRLPEISDSIRDDYQETAEHLSASARGPVGQYEDLSAIDLSRIPTSTARLAADAIDHYRRATNLHAAWRTIWTNLAGAGAKPTWTEYAEATLEQFVEARNAKPTQFPKPDAWAVARTGWTMTLPETLSGAHQRRMNLVAEADQREDDMRRGTRASYLVGPLGVA